MNAQQKQSPVDTAAQREINTGSASPPRTTQRHSSGDSSGSRDSATMSPRPPSAPAYQSLDPSRSIAEQDASRALLDMRGGEQRSSPLPVHASNTDEAPMDLSRSQNEGAARSTKATSPVTSSFAAEVCRQRAAWSLLTGIDTYGLQHLMQRNNNTAVENTAEHTVKNTVKSKVSNKASQDKSRKENKAHHMKSESGKPYHSKLSLKMNNLSQNKNNKLGTQNPKECWVSVDKNMVFSLVEDLAISSLNVEASEPDDRSDTPVCKSDKASFSENEVSNNKCESPNATSVCDRNNAYNLYKTELESSKNEHVVYNSDKEAEIDVENIDQDRERFESNVNSVSQITPEFTQTPRPFVDDKQLREHRHIEPIHVSHEKQPRQRKRSQTEAAKVANQSEKESSPPAGTRKRKRSMRADNRGEYRASSGGQLPVTDVSNERSSRHDDTRASPDRNADQYLNEALALRAMPALICNPALMRHLVEAAHAENAARSELNHASSASPPPRR